VSAHYIVALVRSYELHSENLMHRAEGAHTDQAAGFIAAAATWAQAAATLRANFDIAADVSDQGDDVEWNERSAAFLAAIDGLPGLWLVDADMKYLTMRIDTRDGRFLLFDRHDHPLALARVTEAARKAREKDR
jgi:hypothetical protein